MTKENTKMSVMTSLMAAMVFVSTYIIRIPNPATGGYSHLGDCMIFLAVVLLGRKHGAMAAAIGGGLSDLLAGAAVWIVPTAVIKFLMAFIMGTLIYKKPFDRKMQFAAAACGGLFQIIAYTLVKVVLIGAAPAILSIPNVTLQTLFGILIFAVLSKVLRRRLTAFSGNTYRENEVEKRR